MWKAYFIPFILICLVGTVYFFYKDCTRGRSECAKGASSSGKGFFNNDGRLFISSPGELREKPSLCSMVLSRLEPGTVVQVREKDKYGWVHVSSETSEGWIHMKFLSDDFNYLDDTSPSMEKYKVSQVHMNRVLASRGSSVAAGVVQTAYKCIGIPYVWGGSSPSGFDCSGFVQWVYAKNGVSISRTADIQYTEGTPVSKLEPGDLVFFTTYAPGASHVGIYLACTLFIHASSSGSVRISSLDDEFYKSVFLGGRRYFR